MKHASVPAALLTLALLLAAVPASAAPDVLWQIGRSDDSAGEFALAPNNYGAFKADGVFCVGISRPETDWPYVHPGPGDNWAGGKTHPFSVFFNLDKAPEEGECSLVLDLADTHHYAPPRLRIELNGKGVDRKTEPGSGSDAFLSGASDKGKETLITVTFPASTLRAGENTVTITPLAGSSWAVYDALWLEAPRGAKLAKTTMPFVQLGAPTSPPLLLESGGNLLQVLRVPVRHF